MESNISSEQEKKISNHKFAVEMAKSMIHVHSEYSMSAIIKAIELDLESGNIER